jgi:hypothetical protein
VAPRYQRSAPSLHRMSFSTEFDMVETMPDGFRGGYGEKRKDRVPARRCPRRLGGRVAAGQVERIDAFALARRVRRPPLQQHRGLKPASASLISWLR